MTPLEETTAINARDRNEALLRQGIPKTPKADNMGILGM